MSGEVKVRLKMAPHEETVLKGGEHERLDLQRQGLLYEGTATTDEGVAPHEETVLKGGERERLDLQRQGLLYEGTATTDEGARRAVEREQAAKAAGQEK